ncbi:telomere-protecting terminal protein Tpg [Streptomyces sp. NPDC059740]|uniref:telomere-protecting terminal protein Tpg n=1 Tax=Streptomyces sp. NPDC059740 TaxID=3346926 RepID=UPI00366A2933
MALPLSANTIREALDRADSRHWTRKPPLSMRGQLAYLFKQYRHDSAALAHRLQTDPAALRVLRTLEQTPQDHPLRPAVEREVIRLWQPRVRRRAHEAIIANNGHMMLSFRAWLGFTAAAGSSDDPRLRFLTLSLTAPYPQRLFAAQHQREPEEALRTILNGALSACYFHRDRPALAKESVSLERIDFLEFYY